MFNRRERLLGGLTAAVAATSIGFVLAGPSQAATTFSYTAFTRGGGPVPASNHPRGAELAIGDVFVVDEVLKNASGNAVGYSSGSCVTTNTGGLAHCLVTGAIPGGSITVAGIINFNRDEFTLAVVGGTGKYAGASGWMVGRNVDDVRTTLTFTLE